MRRAWRARGKLRLRAVRTALDGGGDAGVGGAGARLGGLGLVPDHRVKAMDGAEAVTLVEIARAGVALRDGEREAFDAGGFEAGDAVAQQRGAEAKAAQRGADAELRDVRGVLAHAAAEHHAEELAGARVAQDPGALGVKRAAAGEAHDVVQKALRAVDAAVLVVDAAVDVTDVGEVNEL